MPSSTRAHHALALLLYSTAVSATIDLDLVSVRREIATEVRANIEAVDNHFRARRASDSTNTPRPKSAVETYCPQTGGLDLYLKGNTNCMRAICVEGVNRLRAATASCLAGCVEQQVSYMNAAQKDFALFQKAVNDDGDEKHMPTCGMQRDLESTPEFYDSQRQFCKYIVTFRDLYKTFLKFKSSGCSGSGGCVEDKDCNAEHVCIAGECKERCGSYFSSSGGGPVCHPCKEVCRGGFCQDVKPTEDPYLEFGEEVLFAAVDASCMEDPHNEGKLCLDILKPLNYNTKQVSGTFSVPLDGSCTLVDSIHPDEKFGVIVTSSDGTEVTSCELGTEYSVKQYNPTAGNPCAEHVGTFKVKAGVDGAEGACHKPTSVQLGSAITDHYPYEAIAEIEKNLLDRFPYISGSCKSAEEATPAVKLVMTYSPNQDCTMTKGKFAKDACAGFGNVFAATSCCAATMIEQGRCTDATEFEEQWLPVIEHVKDTCDFPGNDAMCPGSYIDVIKRCAQKTQKVQEKFKFETATDEVWASLSEEEKLNTLTAMFGMNSKEVQGITVTKGQVEVDVVASEGRIKALDLKVVDQANAAIKKGNDLSASVDRGTAKQSVKVSLKSSTIEDSSAGAKAEAARVSVVEQQRKLEKLELSGNATAIKEARDQLAVEKGKAEALGVKIDDSTAFNSGAETTSVATGIAVVAAIFTVCVV
jgi:hypothetical protein